MIQKELQETRLGYLKGVLSERWPVPSSIPTLLAFSRDSNVTAVAFGRLGFRVEEISADEPPESLKLQLPERVGCFDVVCCWDLLEHHEDWQDIVGMLARALRSGGVFFYSASGRVNGRGRELQTLLRRRGLSPQPVVGLGPGAERVPPGPARRIRTAAYVGYAFRRSDRVRGQADRHVTEPRAGLPPRAGRAYRGLH